MAARFGYAWSVIVAVQRRLVERPGLSEVISRSGATRLRGDAEQIHVSPLGERVHVMAVTAFAK